MEKINTEKFQQLDYLYKKIDTLYSNLALKVKFSHSGFCVLYSIAEFGEGCLQKDIAKRYSISPQTLSSAIRKLEEDNYIYLKRGHGRNMHMFLTEKGESFIRHAVDPLREAESKVFEIMSPEESSELLRLTQKYVDLLVEKVQQAEIRRAE